MKDTTETVGTISKITFRNSEGWSVFTVTGQDQANTNCTGVLSEMLAIGSDVTCVGLMVKAAKYGQQLKCEKIYPSPVKIDSEAGVLKILQRLNGIGEKKAQLAIDEYGAEKAWELAKTDPEKIGVHPDRAEQAKIVANQLVPSINATIYLLSIGMTDNKASKIIRHFGVDEAQDIVQNNPYRIMEIDGFGFLTADKIALQAGIGVGSTARTMACIMHILLDSQNNQGNIFFYGKPLVAIVCEMMLESAKTAQVPITGMPDYEAVRSCVYMLQQENKAVIVDGKVYSKKLLDAEIKIEHAILGGDKVF